MLSWRWQQDIWVEKVVGNMSLEFRREDWEGFVDLGFVDIQMVEGVMDVDEIIQGVCNSRKRE